MTFDDICISTYGLSAEERYAAGIILEYLGTSPSDEKKSRLREAAGSREGLADLLADAFSHTKADRIEVVRPDDLPEAEEKYSRIVDAYQEKLRPEIFSENVTDQLFRFLADCISMA